MAKDKALKIGSERVNILYLSVQNKQMNTLLIATNVMHQKIKNGCQLATLTMINSKT